ncbi:hypothetical protein NPIL_323921 [Nephila pilipes]|uniref:Uncharacterized protein n=1 Tax=Nephila pilipes TaxID=299642 RepID=A0A8X6U057_NEPPI|nr:hypothetical protein NPIL_323921 [Nephila pilipes]
MIVSVCDSLTGHLDIRPKTLKIPLVLKCHTGDYKHRHNPRIPRHAIKSVFFTTRVRYRWKIFFQDCYREDCAENPKQAEAKSPDTGALISCDNPGDYHKK